MDLKSFLDGPYPGFGGETPWGRDHDRAKAGFHQDRPHHPNSRGRWARFGWTILLGLVLTLGLMASPMPLQADQPKALLALVIDDWQNFDLWAQLAKDCEKYGFKTTLALDTRRVGPQDWPRLAELVHRGHEISSHSVGHVPFSMDGVLRLRFFKPKVTSATAWINPTEKHLQVFLDQGQTPVLDLDLSATGHQPTLKALVGAINKQPGFAAELADPYYANVQSRFLEPDQKVDILFSSGFIPLFVDEEPHVHFEMTTSKEAIEDNIPGYHCQTVVYPFLVHDQVTQQVARQIGFIAGRTGPSGNRFLDSPDGYNLFNVWAEKPKELFGEVKSPEFSDRVKAFLKEFKSKGGAGCLYSHGAGEFSNEEWKILLENLAADPEVRIVTLAELATDIIEHDCKDDDGLYRICPPGQ